MQKFIPAIFIVLMAGLVSAKFALAEEAQVESAQQVVTYSVF